ncbi:hypothetical protein [Thalassotalea euphylliae]|uniref:Uncharacterized protein n=1 Tax=Thalassotalea euphylliae TaxID=1655234 RepID=A0A3E0UKW0_9GAMM|nr:hypothetical protein [Thalassotalea euphylliae]REL32147.1 hypothetical protein DXX94_16265 [Thalassotalea euphylliae]REL36372.1 hypothetical protein DXX92_14205 [Thalassotalea euphylliae]
MIEKNYITSGRNTIIHKVRKIDLIILNGTHNNVIVSHRGIGVYKGVVPRKKSEAKKAYQEVIDVGSIDVFGEEKKLLFIQALDNKEYKIDYTKEGTPNFIKIHQENYI